MLGVLGGNISQGDTCQIVFYRKLPNQINTDELILMFILKISNDYI